MTQNTNIPTSFAFDWYQATFYSVSAEVIINSLLGHYKLSSARPIKGQNSYTHGISISRGDDCIARVFWGGVNGNDPHVISTSHNSPGVSSFLRDNFPDHRVTRVDVCEDYTGDGTWDLLYTELERFALHKGLKLSQVGDYTRGENGRTLYVGSPKSIVYLRLYEKGHESGHSDKNWVRLEIVVRPKKAKAREHFASQPPQAFFGASAWSLELYGHLTSLSVPRVASGTIRQPSDDEKAYAHMVKQYGRVMGRLIATRGVDSVFESLRSDIMNIVNNDDVSTADGGSL